MKRVLKRTYVKDPTYRNFLLKEYGRRVQAHKDARGPELPSEDPQKEESNFKQLYSAIKKRKFIAIPIILAAVLIMVAFTKEVITTTAFAALLILASYSTVYKRKMGMPLGGIELVTFGTVVVAVAFNPVAGLVFGFVSSLASEIISANIGPVTWLYVVTMSVLGFLSGVFSQIHILILGMATTVITLAVNQLIYFVVGDPEVKNFTAFYMVANTLFNLLLFATLGTRTVALLSY